MNPQSVGTHVLLTDAELVWLRAVLACWRAGHPIDRWRLRIELRDQLPPDFEVADLRSPFVINGLPTLLGIFALDPADALISEVESTILAVRDQIFADPNVREVTANDVGDQLGKTAEYTDELFRLMGTAGRFFTGSSGKDQHLYLRIRLDEQCLPEYLTFDGIEAKLRRLSNAAARFCNQEDIDQAALPGDVHSPSGAPETASESIEARAQRMWTCHDQAQQGEFRNDLRESRLTADAILRLRDTRPVGLSGPTLDVAEEHARFLERLAAERRHSDGAIVLDQKFSVLRAPRQLEKDYSTLVDAGVHIGALAFLDIDSFKVLNTRFTEEVVDRCFLQPFQEEIASLVSGRGTAYSRGGDEFVILLPNHVVDEATAFAERVREKLRDFTADVGGSSVSVTVSVGLAPWTDSRVAFESLCDAAGSAKRVAKREGKDRVVLAADLKK